MFIEKLQTKDIVAFLKDNIKMDIANINTSPNAIEVEFKSDSCKMRLVLSDYYCVGKDTFSKAIEDLVTDRWVYYMDRKFFNEKYLSHRDSHMKRTNITASK